MGAKKRQIKQKTGRDLSIKVFNLKTKRQEEEKFPGLFSPKKISKFLLVPEEKEGERDRVEATLEWAIKILP